MFVVCLVMCYNKENKRVSGLENPQFLAGLLLGLKSANDGI